MTDSVPTFREGDHVYYHVRGGWGGGSEYRLYAVIKGLVGKTMACVKLWNERNGAVEVKRIKLSSLSPRTVSFDLLDSQEGKS